jgi:hypothetical protein
MAAFPINVCFTPKSGHQESLAACADTDNWREEAAEVAQAAVRENWTVIMRVANALLECGELTSGEISTLVASVTWR